MKQYSKPHFIIKKNLQKTAQTGIMFSSQLSKETLQDVCRLVTGQSDYTVDYASNDYSDDFFAPTYNKGRMAILFYGETANYITFSEQDIRGRNSSVQSVPTAFNIFYANPYEHKRLFYYFISLEGAKTDYQIMMYRLMHTIGFEFLNLDSDLLPKVTPFVSIDDIMNTKKISAQKNRGNNSTYITKSGINNYDVYGKTYGANKYDTSMVCYALSRLATKQQRVTLYEVIEKDLKELPYSSLSVLRKMGNIKVIKTDMQLEREAFKKNNSLRSPRYTFNLLERLGPKHCTLCSCEIPEIIQGAHIWPVANIKASALSEDEKLSAAIDGENGLWLCENHHKLFDEHIIQFDKQCRVTMRKGLDKSSSGFINQITSNKVLSKDIITQKFMRYMERRNAALCSV